MEKLGLNEIREKFLEYFEKQGHLRLKSFSLIPHNDKSLLIINSGMAPMKPYFAGTQTPPRNRVATCQKCIRTGDIEEVGLSDRHGSFFEMLGNFSFGDYFKREAIKWAWEFMIDILKFDADKLHVTVYHEDDEAYNIWEKEVGLASSRIFRMGKDTNFWEHGLGPCGPSSEIFYDRGPKHGQDDFLASDAAGEHRYIEVWNLVFTQFSKEEDGSYSNLANPNIDTGMGLDRMAMVMQGVPSIFDVDTAKAIREQACKIAKITYGADAKRDISIRVITDHIRSIIFMTADGILPGNEGRGYVLRRLLRRAVRHGRLLGIREAFLVRLAEVAIIQSDKAYPELAEKRDYIHKLIGTEEARFHETLDSGMELLRSMIADLQKNGTKALNGTDAFKLYDTYGFPLELTQEILEEQGFKLDEAAFRSEMEKQRKRGRDAREESTFLGAGATVYDGLDCPPTEFVGHDTGVVENARILFVDSGENGAVSVIVDRTPIYAEGGGQRGDSGKIVCPNGAVDVTDCKRVGDGLFVHIGVSTGVVNVGDIAKITFDAAMRSKITAHHSATHILHGVLKQVLGGHVQQAGSLVTENRLRFDFTHFAPVSQDELSKIEKIVNALIFENCTISIESKSLDEARASGATALFGEKYGERVRVVTIEDHAELCGGSHVGTTAEIGVFKILSEAGIAAGVRRIEAVCGPAAIDDYKRSEALVSQAAATLKTKPENLLAKIEQLLTANKEAARELEQLKAKSANSAIDDILAAQQEVGGITLLCGNIPNADINGLRNLGDALLAKVPAGVCVLTTTTADKATIIAMAADEAIKAGAHCGNLIKAAATAAGGGGGGRPNMAQAGISADEVDIAIEAAKKTLKA